MTKFKSLGLLFSQLNKGTYRKSLNTSIINHCVTVSIFLMLHYTCMIRMTACLCDKWLNNHPDWITIYPNTEIPSAIVFYLNSNLKLGLNALKLHERSEQHYFLILMKECNEQTNSIIKVTKLSWIKKNLKSNASRSENNA